MPVLIIVMSVFGNLVGDDGCLVAFDVGAGLADNSKAYERPNGIRSVVCFWSSALSVPQILDRPLRVVVQYYFHGEKVNIHVYYQSRGHVRNVACRDCAIKWHLTNSPNSLPQFPSCEAKKIWMYRRSKTDQRQKHWRAQNGHNTTAEFRSPSVRGGGDVRATRVLV